MSRKTSIGRTRRQGGGSMIEVAFMVPWIFFLFVGVLDMGFYCYAAMAVQNAARQAALVTSQGTGSATDDQMACNTVIAELQMLPNVPAYVPGSSASCLVSGSVSDSQPVLVDAQAVTGPDGQPASRVLVTYLSIQMIPIPGILTGKLQFSRAVEVRIAS